MKLPFYGVGVDLPHLVSKIWAVRVGIKICEIAILLGGCRSATPDLPNMSCQNRNQNLWNCCSTGVELPHLVCQICTVRVGIKICEIAVLQGVDLLYLVYQIWAVRIRIKICEIAILWGGVDLPHFVCQIWAVRIGIKICEIAILWDEVDLPHLVCQIWGVRIGIKFCEIAILLGGGRSATPGQPNMKC